MSSEISYLTLEPFVHASVNKNSVFLYNTLNTGVLESDSPPVINLVKKLRQGDKMQVIKFDPGQIKRNSDIRQFIKKAGQRFMVDLIPGQKGENKPVQFFPITGLMREPGKQKPSVYRFARQGIIYLKELNIFINGTCELDCRICDQAYRQFPCCHKSFNDLLAIDLESIKNILGESVSLGKVNIMGGNILKHPEFPALLEYLKETDTAKNLYIHYLNLAAAAFDLDIFSHPAIFLNILVPFPVLQMKLKKILTLLEEKNLNYRVGFVVQTENELIEAQEIAENFSIKQFSFSPFYNGRNITFFKKYVYVKKKAILEAKPSIKEIFSRMVINRNYFGKLAILSSGDIHANVNEKSLGSIKKRDSLRSVIYRELQKGKSWLQTRDKVKPCRECHYRFLCPSISNYDYAVGKHNLCTIRKEK